jgi:hypothetical protein
VIVLGTASEPEVQRQWEDMARDYWRGGDARLVLRYDEGLAHRIYAGADMILVGAGMTLVAAGMMLGGSDVLLAVEGMIPVAA